MDGGLAAEVEALYTAGLRGDEPAIRAIGYREFFEIGPPPWSPRVLAEITRRIQRDTRRYAKRQLTFFRRLPLDIEWINADDTTAFAALVAAM